MRSVKRIGWVVLAALVLSTAACGRSRPDAVVDSGADATAVARTLAESADQTAGATTARVHLTMATTVAGPKTSKLAGDLSFTVTGDGAYDTAADLSSMEIDLGGALSGLVAGLPSSARSAVEDEFDRADMQQQIVQHGSIAYVKTPTSTSTYDSSLAGKWLRIDTGKVQDGSSAPANPLGGFRGVGDPQAVLDFLKGVGADAATVGHEDIDGVDTTHLHATVSMQDALAAAGTDRSRIDAAARGLPGVGSAIEDLSFPVDVYVDADGYVRRIAITYDLTDVLGAAADDLGGDDAPAALTGLGLSMTMTLDYSDFGQPVTITEPTPDQTVDFCDYYGKDVEGSFPSMGC